MSSVSLVVQIPAYWPGAINLEYLWVKPFEIIVDFLAWRRCLLLLLERRCLRPAR